MLFRSRLVAYELRLAGSGGEAPAEHAPAGGAQAAEVEAALDDWREALLAIGYLNPDNPDAILAEARRLLGRAGVTTREVTVLRGMARQILWAARRVAPGSGRGA